ncbi:nucleotidyltransferase family protein [Candidatus Solincola sp.]|nr:nucleotidyltransferase domain-containing protein [Actinomycetota bacterium]
MRIRYLDRAAIEDALRSYIHRLASEFPEVRRVVLFGSFVREEGVPGSDVDILIELSGSKLPFLDRIPRYLPRRFPVGVDVFPYTTDELRTLLEEGNHFLRRALDEGREILSR